MSVKDAMKSVPPAVLVLSVFSALLVIVVGLFGFVVGSQPPRMVHSAQNMKVFSLIEAGKLQHAFTTASKRHHDCDVRLASFVGVLHECRTNNSRTHALINLQQSIQNEALAEKISSFFPEFAVRAMHHTGGIATRELLKAALEEAMYLRRILKATRSYCDEHGPTVKHDDATAVDGHHDQHDMTSNALHEDNHDPAVHRSAHAEAGHAGAGEHHASQHAARLGSHVKSSPSSGLLEHAAREGAAEQTARPADRHDSR
eukprot:TRINITY_DN46620_c0_g1_i1.p1 TRINITY_DN46620_c0_g1~~TRINITY_DN46620_c0_g1_i1.p1  ORF type:complete len:297 (+),score=29.23 TRINITY_DN46620_c0_g1_i1:120-893(+)